MNVREIAPGIFQGGGINEGTPCVILSFWLWRYVYSFNEMVDRIKATWLKLLRVRADTRKTPEIKPFLEQITTWGFKSIVVMDWDDDIEPLRSIANVNFILQVTVPTAKENNINDKNLPLLREWDVIKFAINSEAMYDTTLEFIKRRIITRPTINFHVQSDAVWKLISEKVLKDVTTLNTNVKITNANY